MNEHINPAWYSKHKIIPIELQTKIEDIPTPSSCEYCGQQMEKTYYPYTCGVDTLIQARETPAYKCVGCNTISLSPEACLEALTIARQILFELGETETAQSFSTSIIFEQEIVNMRWNR